MWFKVGTSNINPLVIAHYFLSCVKEHHSEMKLLLLIKCDNNGVNYSACDKNKVYSETIVTFQMLLGFFDVMFALKIPMLPFCNHF